jgi:hypothetical protein
MAEVWFESPVKLFIFFRDNSCATGRIFNSKHLHCKDVGKFFKSYWPRFFRRAQSKSFARSRRY